MTKAYLAGFIAGTQGLGWEHCPFEDEYCFAAVQWRNGQVDGRNIYEGCQITGKEITNECPTKYTSILA